MADLTRELDQYVNSKLPTGVKIDGRWHDIQTVPIPEGYVYFDHKVEVTAKNPPDDPTQWGHQTSLMRHPANPQHIIGVENNIHCENHNLFASGRWYGTKLTVFMNRTTP